MNAQSPRGLLPVSLATGAPAPRLVAWPDGKPAERDAPGGSHAA